MINYIIIFIAISILICMCFYNNFNYNDINDINNFTNNNPCKSLNLKNQEQCYKSKYIPCCNLNGTFKQCTNNFKHKNKCICDQNTLNLDICDKSKNDKCYYKNENVEPNPFVLPNDNCNRVNMYNPEITIFDKLK